MPFQVFRVSPPFCAPFPPPFLPLQVLSEPKNTALCRHHPNNNAGSEGRHIFCGAGEPLHPLSNQYEYLIQFKLIHPLPLPNRICPSWCKIGCKEKDGFNLGKFFGRQCCCSPVHFQWTPINSTLTSPRQVHNLTVVLLSFAAGFVDEFTGFIAGDSTVVAVCTISSLTCR